MRIAISTDKDTVSMHFGRCPSFTIIDIKDGKIVNKKLIDNPGHQPGIIPQFLHQHGVQCIICGGMGNRAKTFFDEFGIQVLVGVSGNIEDVIKNIQKGTLKGGESLCNPGSGKGYGLDKTECNHSKEKKHNIS